jgi:hypothetical protein
MSEDDETNQNFHVQEAFCFLQPLKGSCFVNVEDSFICMDYSMNFGVGGRKVAQ